MTRTRTTRYVTLLRFILALALTAALAACASDEPSGGTVSDRTASTPTETPASAETDREALVVLYNATDGGNWNRSDNRLSDAPLGEWYGVDTNDDRRVTVLILDNNGLSGEIPAELGSLSNLTELELSDNDLSGEIPLELGRLANLSWMGLSGNGLICRRAGSISRARHSKLTSSPPCRRVQPGPTIAMSNHVARAPRPCSDDRHSGHGATLIVKRPPKFS